MSTHYASRKNWIELAIGRRMSPISYSQGVAMARDIGVSTYCECSAFTRHGVKNVFEEATRIAGGCPIILVVEAEIILTCLLPSVNPSPSKDSKKASCIIA